MSFHHLRSPPISFTVTVFPYPATFFTVFEKQGMGAVNPRRVSSEEASGRRGGGAGGLEGLTKDQVRDCMKNKK